MKLKLLCYSTTRVVLWNVGGLTIARVAIEIHAFDCIHKEDLGTSVAPVIYRNHVG
jgi:hypothetical protein